MLISIKIYCTISEDIIEKNYAIRHMLQICDPSDLVMGIRYEVRNEYST